MQPVQPQAIERYAALFMAPHCHKNARGAGEPIRSVATPQGQWLGLAIRSEQKASVSPLQRRCRPGYGRAARIMDELENRGLVGPSRGAEPLDILIGLDVAPPTEAAP